MQETPWRDRGDGRATGQPSRGTAGLGPEAHLSVRRKVRDPRRPGRTAISAVAAGGSCIMRAKHIAVIQTKELKRPAASRSTSSKCKEKILLYCGSLANP